MEQPAHCRSVTYSKSLKPFPGGNPTNQSTSDICEGINWKVNGGGDNLNEGHLGGDLDRWAQPYLPFNSEKCEG